MAVGHPCLHLLAESRHLTHHGVATFYQFLYGISLASASIAAVRILAYTSSTLLFITFFSPFPLLPASGVLSVRLFCDGGGVIDERTQLTGSGGARVPAEPLPRCLSHFR